ncbi:MAG: hypothetical protein WHV44_07490 [Anaerolineales bacterium]
MCMFCASIPAAVAVGAKLNADQKKAIVQGKATKPRPIAAITTGMVVLLVVGSAAYHTMAYQ